MNTREIAAEYRMAYWSGIIEERTASGTTIRKFCEQAGYKEHTYYYWQHKLRKAACRELLPAAQMSRQEASVPAGWAVCAPKEPRCTKSVTIEIGDCKVIVEPDVNPERLKEVCRVLLSLC